MPVEAILADNWQGDGTAPSSALERSAAGLEPYSPLSAREWEIACHVARGDRNREIARALVLTERTVGSHLERVFARLHIKNRAQLAAWVAQRTATAVPGDTAEAAALAEQSVSARSRQRSRQLRVLGQ